MAKKFFDLDNISNETGSMATNNIRNITNEENNMIAAPTSIESLDESNLMNAAHIASSDEIETLDEVETLDGFDNGVSLKKSKKNSSKVANNNEVKKEDNSSVLFENIKIDKKPETFINNDSMGSNIFKEQEINYKSSPIFNSINNEVNYDKVGVQKQKITSVVSPLNNIDLETKTSSKKSINLNLIIFLCSIIILVIIFYIGHDDLTCTYVEEDSNIKATTVIKTYYLYNHPYFSKYKIYYDFTNNDEINTKSFAIRMESTLKDKKNLRIKYDDESVSVSYNKFLKSIRSGGINAARKDYVDEGYTCK